MILSRLLQRQVKRSYVTGDHHPVIVRENGCCPISLPDNADPAPGAGPELHHPNESKYIPGVIHSPAYF
ncbi:MAG: hypothetical protein IJV42_01895 [Bacteroidaceae bacterium]|nr:hypothetical protein [Bacteroidaceae bacterium]